MDYNLMEFSKHMQTGPSLWKECQKLQNQRHLEHLVSCPLLSSLKYQYRKLEDKTGNPLTGIVKYISNNTVSILLTFTLKFHVQKCLVVFQNALDNCVLTGNVPDMLLDNLVVGSPLPVNLIPSESIWKYLVFVNADLIHIVLFSFESGNTLKFITDIKNAVHTILLL